jgi:tellurite methyltransferase
MNSVTNAQKYGPPNGYYDITKNKPPRSLLVEALDGADGSGKLALDFGCGAGSDTKYLLKKNFEVEAVDGSKAAWDYLKLLPHQERLHFKHSDFESFKFGSYDFINAAYSLPFADNKEFSRIFKDLKNSLNPDGLFVGQLFGVNDQYKRPGETMTFLNKAEVEDLLKDLKIIKLKEIEKDGKLANGKPKHWHYFDIIAQSTNA